MRCPSCNGFHHQAIETTEKPMDGVARAEKAITRKRKCVDCRDIFTTYEIIAGRLEALKTESQTYRQSIGYKKVMAGSAEKQRIKLTNFLLQNSRRKFIFEGTIIKTPREISAEDVSFEIDKFLARGGKMPVVKYHATQTFIVFDVNKWVRVI